MHQTIFYNKEYRNLIKEQVITLLLLYCVAIASVFFAMFHHKNYSLPIILVIFSLYPIVEIFVYRKAFYQIDIDDSTCTFISNKCSVTVPISDIESLITYANNFTLLQLKNTTGFMLVNACMIIDDTPKKRQFYIKWNNLFHNKQLNHEKLLESFIKAIKSKNKKFIVKTETC